MIKKTNKTRPQIATDLAQVLLSIVQTQKIDKKYIILYISLLINFHSDICII